MEVLAIGILVLGLLIIVHELGHLIAGLRLGVKVLKFSIGLGPRVAGFQWKGIEWAVSAIPLGGFVKFSGDDPGEETEPPKPDDFLVQSWWVKILVAVAGPAMNIVLAFLLLYAGALIGFRVPDPDLIIGPVEADSKAEAVGFRSGDRIVDVAGFAVSSGYELEDVWDSISTQAGIDSMPIVVARENRFDTLFAAVRGFSLEGITLDSPPVVGELTVGLPAFEAGLQEGDSIVAAAGSAVGSFSELQEIVLANPETDLEMRFVREGQTLSTTVRPIKRADIGQGEGGIIGIMPPQRKFRTLRFGPLSAIEQSARMTAGTTAGIYAALYRMVRNPAGIRRQLGGPIAIAQLSAKQAKKGFDSLLNFVALISIMLAVMNLLPIPILDGGMILFSFIEGIRSRPLSHRAQLILQRIGFAFLVTLMLFAVMNDIGRVFQRRKAIDKPVEFEEQGTPTTVGSMET